MSAAEDDAARPGRAICCGAASCGRPLPPLPSGVRLLSALRSCAETSFCTRLSMDSSEVGGAELARLTSCSQCSMRCSESPYVSHHAELKPMPRSRHLLYASRRNSSSYERQWDHGGATNGLPSRSLLSAKFFFPRSSFRIRGNSRRIHIRVEYSARLPLLAEEPAVGKDVILLV